jgi:hypothetical protein
MDADPVGRVSSRCRTGRAGCVARRHGEAVLSPPTPPWRGQLEGY